MELERMSQTEKMKRVLKSINYYCKNEIFWGINEAGTLANLFCDCQLFEEANVNIELPAHLYVYYWSKNDDDCPLEMDEVMSTFSYNFWFYNLDGIADKTFKTKDGRWLLCLYYL